MDIKKGDKVKIIYGSQKGKTGTVERVISDKGTLLVSGVNLVKKSLKSQGVVQVQRPIAGSKAVVICPKCQKTTRVYHQKENGKKVRVCRECKLQI